MNHLHINLKTSELSPHLRWNVDWNIEAGQANWLRGPNGIGKTSLLEELKCQWPSMHPGILLGFTDQAPLDPFQDLTVSQVFELLWDIVPERRSIDRWQNMSEWDTEGKSLWNRPVKLLSGGENQWIKLMMMRSLKSQLWLLDEPFQFLDQQRALVLQDWLAQWCQQGNYLIVTHHNEANFTNVKAWSLHTTSIGLAVKGSL